MTLMSKAVIAIALLASIRAVHAAQVGIKYNRGAFEYPKVVLRDLQRLHADRIDTIMLCLPWAQWEPLEGQLNSKFIATGLTPVMDFCASNNITVVISSHCDFWGEEGDWSIPGWVRNKPEYKSSTSCLTEPGIRALHISYLTRMIDATKDFPAVVGYNILNEPVTATKWFLEKAKGSFLGRWDGILQICGEVRRHMKEVKAHQYLIIGNHGAEEGLESYCWKRADKYDLFPLWSQTLDKIAAQGTTALRESCKWYPDRPKIRTESSLNFAVLGGIRDTEDFGAKVRPKKDKGPSKAAVDPGTVYYDYDSIYDYEGLANASVPMLEAFYAWRIGSPDGSVKHLAFLDHRHGDRPTSYYWAMRDLASGVDSFETYDKSAIPKGGKETFSFDPPSAQAGISKRWTGTGSLEGQKQDLPPGTDSTIAARMVLQPGQSVMRSVIAAHWKDSGVRATDAFTFQGRADASGNLTLVVVTKQYTRMVPFALQQGDWRAYRIPLRALNLGDGDISTVQKVGFTNQSRNRQSLVIDDFLIRP